MTPTPLPTATVQAPLVNPAIPPSGDGGTTPNIALPSSDLPPITSNGTLKIDPENPTGIIPSTGNSTYDIDVTQFEGSGQPWRRPGSDIQDWFNFGFDEVTYPKFLRYRQEMEIGRAALVRLPTSFRGDRVKGMRLMVDEHAYGRYEPRDCANVAFA